MSNTFWRGEIYTQNEIEYLQKEINDSKDRRVWVPVHVAEDFEKQIEAAKYILKQITELWAVMPINNPEMNAQLFSLRMCLEGQTFNAPEAKP